jgi:hypothetical protein
MTLAFQFHVGLGVPRRTLRWRLEKVAVVRNRWGTKGARMPRPIGRSP